MADDPAARVLEHAGDRRGLAHGDPDRLGFELGQDGFRDALAERLDELVLLVRRDSLHDFEDALVVHGLANAVSGPGRRILFWGHLIESERSQRVRMRVAVEWKGQRYNGDVEGPDLPGPRLEALASAALKAVESAVAPELMERQGRRFHLSLDGVKEFEAFDKEYVLVSVHGASGRDVTTLSGTASVSDSRDRAVIMATLQATDRASSRPAPALAGRG